MQPRIRSVRLSGMPFDPLDLYGLKRQFERANELRDLVRETVDPGFLVRARRALLPLPLLDRPKEVENPLAGRARGRPIPFFKGKRVAVVTTGGGGGAVSLAGVARAFEEAGIRPALLSACSGGAIWGAMWAAGLNGRQMADFSLSWRPQDYLDVQWLRLPRFALSALRGFTGLAKGEAIEHLFDTRLCRMTAGETQFPITTIAYNMDLSRVEYLGSERTPDLTIGELVRTAIALPLFIEAVPFDGHLYVDGGLIELFPAQPVLEDGGFDHVFGLTSCSLRSLSRRTSRAGRTHGWGSSRRAASSNRATTWSSPAAHASGSRSSIRSTTTSCAASPSTTCLSTAATGRA
jgi:NTE family protein